MKLGKLRHQSPGAPDREVRDFSGRHGADPGPAALVEDMLPPLFLEVLDGAERHIGRRRPEAADGGGLHVVPEALHEIEMSRLSLTHDDLLQDLVDVLRPVPAGRALAAGLVVEESGHPVGQVDHADRIVHHDERRGPEKGPRLGHRRIVEVQVELGGVEHGAGGTGGKNGLQGPSPGDASAQVFDDMAERHAQRDLVQTRPADVAGEAEKLRTRRFVIPQGPIPGPALPENPGNGRQGFDVLDVGGRLPETDVAQARRLVSGNPPLPLEAVQERGVFPADVGPRPAIDTDVEAPSGPQDVRSEIALSPRLGQGSLEDRKGVGILLPEVDVSRIGIDGVTGQDHALDKGMGIPLHDIAVLEGPRLPLVGIRDDIVGFGILPDRLELLRGREGAPSPSGQPRSLDLPENPLRVLRGTDLPERPVAFGLFVAAEPAGLLRDKTGKDDGGVRNGGAEGDGLLRHGRSLPVTGQDLRDLIRTDPGIDIGIDLEGRGVDALPETLGRLQREKAIPGRLVEGHPQLLLKGLQEALSPAENAGRGKTDADGVTPFLMEGKVLVEGPDPQKIRLGHARQPSDVLQGLGADVFFLFHEIVEHGKDGLLGVVPFRQNAGKLAHMPFS